MCAVKAVDMNCLKALLELTGVCYTDKDSEFDASIQNSQCRCTVSTFNMSTFVYCRFSLHKRPGHSLFFLQGISLILLHHKNAIWVASLKTIKKQSPISLEHEWHPLFLTILGHERFPKPDEAWFSFCYVENMPLTYKHKPSSHQWRSRDWLWARKMFSHFSEAKRRMNSSEVLLSLLHFYKHRCSV